MSADPLARPPVTDHPHMPGPRPHWCEQCGRPKHHHQEQT